MTEKISSALLNIDQKGRTLYEEFRKERFQEKTKTLSDTIHRTNLPTFASISSEGEAAKKTKKPIRQIAKGYKLFQTAKERGCRTNMLLKFDIVPSNYLFDDEGLIKKADKSELRNDLENNLSIVSDRKTKPWSGNKMKTVYLIDVMAQCRRFTKGFLEQKGVTTFQQFFEQFCTCVNSMCPEADRIDFLFDSYLEGSVKDSERTRREKSKPIELHEITMETKFPKDLERFWPSGKNKTKLQKQLKTFILEKKGFQMFSAPYLVLGALHIDGKLDSCSTIEKTTGLFSSLSSIKYRKGMGPQCDNPLLNNDRLEEADIRMVPHAMDAVKHYKVKRLIIVSEDTDIFVIFLYFWNRLSRHGASELWMRKRTKEGGFTYSPLHTIASKLGSRTKCLVLPALHMLTGCDTTSKVGTKSSAVQEALVDKKGHDKELWKELKGFGETESDLVLEKCFKQAERFLVRIYKPTTKVNTMDALRDSIYHRSESKTLEDLPPTSHSLRDHIKRAFYITFQQVHCLDTYDYDLKATDYGFEKVEDKLMPVQSYNPLPEALPLCCTCKKCARMTCPCRAGGVSCIDYCKCQEPPIECQNKNMTLTTTINLGQ